MVTNGLVIKGIKMSEEVCITELDSICNELDIKMVKNENKGINFDLFKNGFTKCGMIRIFNNSKEQSRTIDGSGKNKELNQQVIDLFISKHKEDIVLPIKGPGKCARYDIKSDDFDIIRNNIEMVASKNGYTVEIKNCLSHMYYMLSVTDEHSGDKAVITQFNSGVLIIQGKSWNVWDELCNAIDEILNSSVFELIVRFTSDSDSIGSSVGTECDEPQITNIITSDLQSKGKEKIISRLSNVYPFLYAHDKILIEATQCMLISKVNYGDYYCYIASALRVIDGYFKKVIIDLGLKTEAEINAVNPNGTPTFNYGNIFNGLNNIIPAIKARLVDGRTSRDDKERALLDIYKLYRNTRSPFQHDGPPVVRMVPTYEDAESEIDEILRILNSTYDILFI